MLKGFFKLFSRKKLLPEINRKFQHQYFLNQDNNEILKKQGYIKIENCISDEEINYLQDAYHQLCQFPEYSIEDKFQNSGRFRSPEIRNFVMNKIGDFSANFLPKIFDESVFDKNTTGAFQIKPPSKKSELNPHQDSPVIDELLHNAVYVWIPLRDINETNGPVWVLPGSHLWGNHQRSLNVKWIFEKHTKLLWKYMQPISMKKGDILCWDTALIHASSPNLADDTRVAITTTILPKKYAMVDYFQDENTSKQTVEKYEVYRHFWENEDIMKKPSCPPNKFLKSEQVVFPNNLSKKEVEEIIIKHLS